MCFFESLKNVLRNELAVLVRKFLKIKVVPLILWLEVELRAIIKCK